MKNKNFFTVIAFLSMGVLFAQADLGYINGKYFASDGFEFENAMRMKKKQKEDIELSFFGEVGGRLENKLVVKWKGGTLDLFLDEKLYNKKQVVWFKGGGNSFIELEKGVFAVADEAGKRIGDVLAKDKSKFNDFDMDTALALIENMTSELNDEATQKEKQKFMKTHKAYAENIGKVVFSENLRLFSDAFVRSQPEDPAKFIKSQVIGKYIAYQAYFNDKPAQKYGASAELNIEYEFEGQKLDRKSQSKKSRGWASLPRVDAFDEFTMKQGRLLVGDSTIDYVMAQTILNARGKLQYGKSYNLKITIYAYKDGANVAKLAEGTIALKFEPESEKTLNTWEEWIEEKM